jgi:hypothetical protein
MFVYLDFIKKGTREMKIQFHKTSWFKGGFFHWGNLRFNSGDPYTSYRFGPLLIQVRK